MQRLWVLGFGFWGFFLAAIELNSLVLKNAQLFELINI